MGIAHFSDVKPAPAKFSGILQFVFRENDSLKILSVQKFLGVRDLFSKRSCVRPPSPVPSSVPAFLRFFVKVLEYRVRLC